MDFNPLLLLPLLGPILALVIIIPLFVRRERAKLEGFYPTLRVQGPMTLEEIAVATATNPLLKGYLIEALDGAVDAGKLIRHPPPPGLTGAAFYSATRYSVPPPDNRPQVSNPET